jgi:hypothetical protein
MANLLARLVNKLILLSLVSAAEEGASVVCTLVGIEPCGIWVVGDAVLETLDVDNSIDRRSRVFIPFAQIAYLMEPPVKPLAEVLDTEVVPPPATEAPPRTKPKKKH